MRLTKKILLKILKIKKKGNVSIGNNVDFYHTEFKGYNSIGDNCQINSSKVGIASYCGDNCKLSKANIGSFCSIGSEVKVIYGRHPVNMFFSTHPSFYSTKKQSNFTFIKKDLFNENNKYDENFSIKIGSDVWIGSGVSILEGVEIGVGSIIASGSIVIKDVEPYAVVAGVPAKQKYFRFSSGIISDLISTKWWENDIDWFTEENINKLNAIIKKENNKQ